MGIFSKPVIVEWSATNPSHRLHDDLGGSKSIRHDGIGINLLVGPPEFGSETRLRFSASNFGEKTLGFGRGGIGLNAGNGTHARSNFSASKPVHSSQRHYDDPMKDVSGETVMVNEFQAATFDARFNTLPRPKAVNVVIEVKRLFAANYIFVIPFEFE